MKRQIRFGAFETNSSSVHSLTIASKEEFQKFKNRKLFLKDDDHFVPKKEVLEYLKERGHYIERISEQELNRLIKRYGYQSYENFGEDYEYFEYEYKTESGDKIIVFGYSGQDS